MEEKWKIAIVEDEEDVLVEIDRIVRNIWKDEMDDVEICLYGSGRAARAAIRDGGRFDLYLLDVEMPDVDGLKLAGEIRERDGESCIVFVTAHERYALRGYHYRAYHYIMKDEGYQKHLQGVLREIRADWSEQKSKYYVINAIGHGYIRIRMDRIVYLDVEGKNVVFHCKNGERYAERKTLKAVYGELDQKMFVQSHRSIIVNIRHIANIEGGTVRMDGYDELLPVSSHLRETLQMGMMNYWRNR